MQPPDPHATPRRCGAKTRGGGRCKGFPVHGSQRCRMHGGTSPKGPGHPNYVTGKRSAWLPPALRDRIDAAARDPELLALGDHIALLDHRLGELLGRIPEGAANDWGEVKRQFRAYEVARDRGHVSSMGQALEKLGAAIAAGAEEAAVWTEIRLTMDARRKASETERKRQTDMQLLIHGDEALGMMRMLVEAVRRHVTDRGTLDAITADFAGIVGRGGAQPKRLR